MEEPYLGKGSHKNIEDSCYYCKYVYMCAYVHKPGLPGTKEYTILSKMSVQIRHTTIVM